MNISQFILARSLPLVSGIILDILIGDPVFSLHPVRITGLVAKKTEAFFRKTQSFLFPNSTEPGLSRHWPTLFFGALTWLSVLVLILLPLIILLKLSAFALPLRLILETFLVWASICGRDLQKHAQRVQMAMENASLGSSPDSARNAVAMMVGRDVSNANNTDIARACIESVAESFVDGVASPLFWGFMVSPLAAFAYRIINTMDSLFGYRSESYYNFGFLSARADDLANALPARTAGFFTCLMSPLFRMRTGMALRIFWKYKREHKSPNAGYPESAFAACLGLKLGGPVYYKNTLSDRPWLNIDGRPPLPGDINRAIKLFWLSTLAYSIFLLVISSLLFITLSV